MTDKVITCPLGSKCEEIKDNKLHQCAWLVEIKGTNPQTNETKDEKACAIAWMPILQIETSGTQKATHDAVISLREETVSRQDMALQLAATRQLKLVQSNG